MFTGYLLLDLETGGLFSESSLLELSLIHLDNDFNITKLPWGDLNELHLKIKPDDDIYKIHPSAMKVNKIDLGEHDKIAISESVAKQQLYEYLKIISKEGKEKPTPVGVNVYYDINKVHTSLLKKPTWDSFVSYRMLDLGSIWRFFILSGLIPKECKSGLDGMVDYFKIEIKDRHSSKGDTEAYINVMKALFGLINAKNH